MIIQSVQPTDNIQNFLDLLNSAGGGILRFNPLDTFYINQTLNLYSNVTIEGQGSTIDFGGGPYQISVVGSNPYSTGTVAVNYADTTVVGTGTTWTADMIGQSILIGDYWYTILTVPDTTHLTIEYSTGNGFMGTNVTGVSYVIATTINAAAVNNITLTNSTTTALKFQYVNGFNMNTIIVTDSTQGIDGDDSANINLQDGYAIDNCVDGVTYDNVPFCIFKSGLISNITGGTGLALNGVTNTALDSLSIQAVTGVGSKLTNCSNFGFAAFSIIECSSHGLELVSGNNDVDILSGYVNTCGGDGIKFTATSDRNTITSCSVLNNTGYGVNIADATCDVNILISVNTSNNTAGALHDLGTGTLASVAVNNFA